MREENPKDEKIFKHSQFRSLSNFQFSRKQIPVKNFRSVFSPTRHNLQHASWPIRRSTTQFPSQDNHWSSNESQTSVDNMLHRFTGPITLVCDRYVQYLLAGANPSVLNRYQRGLQPWRCRLYTYHSSTFPTDGLHFPPKSPTQFSVKLSSTKSFQVQV
jgi:hypothetical protein